MVNHIILITSVCKHKKRLVCTLPVVLWLDTCVMQTHVIIVFMVLHLCCAYTSYYCFYGLTPVWCIHGVVIVVMS